MFDYLFLLNNFLQFKMSASKNVHLTSAKKYTETKDYGLSQPLMWQKKLNIDAGTHMCMFLEYFLTTALEQFAWTNTRGEEIVLNKH